MSSQRDTDLNLGTEESEHKWEATPPQPKWHCSLLLCGHCETYVPKSTYYHHKERYFDVVSTQWQQLTEASRGVDSPVIVPTFSEADVNSSGNTVDGQYNGRIHGLMAFLLHNQTCFPCNHLQTFISPESIKCKSEIRPAYRLILSPLQGTLDVLVGPCSSSLPFTQHTNSNSSKAQVVDEAQVVEGEDGCLL